MHGWESAGEVRCVRCTGRFRPRRTRRRSSSSRAGSPRAIARSRRSRRSESDDRRRAGTRSPWSRRESTVGRGEMSNSMSARCRRPASSAAWGVRTTTVERPRASVAGNGFSGDEPSPADDDQVVGEHLEFTDQVTRHEDRAALCGEGAQGVPQPANAVGVEAVGRFVEQQHLGLSQQGAGEGEALAHAEREAAGALVRGTLESDLAEDLVDPIHGDRAERGGRPQMVPGCSAGVHAAGVEHRADDACGTLKSRVRTRRDSGRRRGRDG